MYPYTVAGLSKLEQQGDFDHEIFLKNARTSILKYRLLKKQPKLKLNTYGFAEMDLDIKSIQLMGSDTSFQPQRISYSTLVMIKSRDRIAKEAFRRCKQYDACSNQMLSQEALFFAFRQSIMSLDISEEEREEMTKQQDSFNKVHPALNMF